MKDTFYFSHDYNARSDVKIKKLIAKHGFEGYGIYWAIIEDLYNNANALPLHYDSIAYDLRTNENIIKSIIHDFSLFVIDDGYFGSLSVERRLEERAQKSKRAKDAANLRWGKLSERNADAMQTHSEINADAMQTHSDCNAIKESKGKDIKEKKEIKENIIEQFENFWELYGKKVGKEKTQKKFLSLTEKERTKIFKVVDDYIRSTPDIQFRKNPLTWLNGKCWEDEIITNPNSNTQNANVELYKHPSEVTDYRKPDWSRIPRYPNQFENPEEHQAHHALWGNMMRKIWTYEYETTGSRTVTW